LALILNSLLFFAQDKPYWKEIQEFKKLDQTNGIPKKPILFVGSSSFTYWKDVNDYFPGKTIINRGFGGSRLLDLNNYADDLLDPYNPKQIVIYCGENDIATDNPTPPKFWKDSRYSLKRSDQSIRRFLLLMFPSNIRQVVNNSGLK
jgi:hypothetical protein